MDNYNFYDIFHNPDVWYETDGVYLWETDFGKGLEYMYLGYGYGIISRENLESPDYFRPYEGADVKSCAAMILRCLEKVPAFGIGEDEARLGYILDRAKERGLIKEYDDFYNNPEAELTYERLCILLNRMLFEKRYIYFTEEHFSEKNSALLLFDGKNYDEEGSITYLDFLEEKYGSLIAD